MLVKAVRFLLERAAPLYICRFPIFSSVILALLPAICLWLAPTLLANLLVLTTWNFFWSTAAAYIFSWSIQVTYRIAAINRMERFGLPGPNAALPPSRLATTLVRILPLPLLFAIFLLRDQNDAEPNWILYIAAGIGGFVLAYTLAFFAVVVAAVVAPPSHVRAEQFMTIFFAWQRTLLCKADAIEPLRIGRPDRGIRCWLARLRKVLSRDFPNGYVDRLGRLYGGHWIALSSAVLSSLLYLGLGIAKDPNVPALAYVLQLLFLSTWLLAGASFFLDRFRIPLILPIVLVCFLFAIPSFLPWIPPPWFPSSDHYYEIFGEPSGQSSANPALPAPSEVLDAYLKKNDNRVVVVATAGGGIQAAAWTAEVLTQLQSSIQSAPGKASFADSVSLMSGVSGGAVGMMFFGTGYRGIPNAAFPADRASLDLIVSNAETPTLNDVAWGLTNADLGRVLLPFLKFGHLKLEDRGRALEEAWSRTSEQVPSLRIGETRLSAWTSGVKDGHRPALIFNSTIAESGEPLLFATSSLQYSPEVKIDSKSAHRKTFFDEFPGRDTRIVTAARMAASFPFVTPAARPMKQGAAFHQVDGGYYDNYGLSSLMAWLAEALGGRSTDAAAKPEILVLQIQSFPGSPVPDPTWKTWFYQVYAPLDALASVRDAGQLLRDKQELKSFEDSLRSVARFCNVSFGFNAPGAPLSWQMNRDQKDAVRAEWGRHPNDTERVQSFLNPSPGSTRLCDEQPQ